MGPSGKLQTLHYPKHARLTCCCGCYQQCMPSHMWMGTAYAARQSPTAVQLHVHELQAQPPQQPCSPAYACQQALPHLSMCLMLQHGQQQDSLLLLQVLLLLLQLWGMTVLHCCAGPAWQQHVRCQQCFQCSCMPSLQTLQHDRLQKANCWYLRH